MADTVVEALILDLLDWIAERDRTHEEVMNAWRTSCPKLPVWEDACDRGLVKTENGIASITASGRALLAAHLAGTGPSVSRGDSVITSRRKPGDVLR